MKEMPLKEGILGADMIQEVFEKAWTDIWNV